jgi:hypothetical protein
MTFFISPSDALTRKQYHHAMDKLSQYKAASFYLQSGLFLLPHRDSPFLKQKTATGEALEP